MQEISGRMEKKKAFHQELGSEWNKDILLRGRIKNAIFDC